MALNIQSLSVVVPVYNGSLGTLPELIRRLEKVLPDLSREYEVVLVNDGSRDDSWETICALSQSVPWCAGST